MTSDQTTDTTLTYTTYIFKILNTMNTIHGKNFLIFFNIFYEITNRCSYMQSILFHC